MCLKSFDQAWTQSTRAASPLFVLIAPMVFCEKAVEPSWVISKADEQRIADVLDASLPR